MTKTKQGEQRPKEKQKYYVGNYTEISKIQLQKTLHEKTNFFLALRIRENTNQTEKLIFCDRAIEDHLQANNLPGVKKNQFLSFSPGIEKQSFFISLGKVCQKMARTLWN